ncbi:MAG: amino acid ABC transporter permease [Firmicutes bacterium]|nr:amino acid ABC transporter permease [Bacillota bacterium]
MEISVFDWTLLGQGAGITLILSLGTMVISVPLAILLGVIRAITIRNVFLSAFQAVLTVMIAIIRGTPLMLQLMFVFFGLPFLGFNFPPLTASFIALIVYSIAYMAEIVRTGIESIASAQWDGSASLGLNYGQTIRYVILPQAVKIMIPPSVGFFIGLIKDSSLCATIGLVELARAGRIIVERTHDSLQFFSIVALIYFVICYPLSRLSKKLERNLTVLGGSPRV